METVCEAIEIQIQLLRLIVKEKSDDCNWSKEIQELLK
jgi:hypothetical protein